MNTEMAEVVDPTEVGQVAGPFQGTEEVVDPNAVIFYPRLVNGEVDVKYVSYEDEDEDDELNWDLLRNKHQLNQELEEARRRETEEIVRRIQSDWDEEDK